MAEVTNPQADQSAMLEIINSLTMQRNQALDAAALLNAQSVIKDRELSALRAKISALEELHKDGSTGNSEVVRACPVDADDGAGTT